RYYDPATQQFLSRDPLESSTNQPYTYGAGNPVTLVDPTGNAPEKPWPGQDTPLIGLTLENPEEAAIVELAYLFRGTSKGWPGNPGLQRLRITPATSDPLVGTLFATSAETRYGSGILHIALPGDLEGVGVIEGNVLGTLEAEVGIELSPLEFAERASIDISASEARGILADMEISVPSRVHGPADISRLLHNTPRLATAQVIEFVRRAQSLLDR
ncbi:MAG: RHS repeat-associated core domain-containing protein, partial [Chloroflexia bacterium]